MRRLGIVTLVEPDNGGVFQYAHAMVEALQAMPGWNKTIYRPRGSSAFTEFGLPIKELATSKLRSLAQGLAAGLRAGPGDPFAGEDVVISAMYSPYLLHTRAPFLYTLHDLQERHLPSNFSFLQRQWRAFIQPRIATRAVRIICESNFVRDDIVRFFHISPDKVAVIPAPPLWQAKEDADGYDPSAVRIKYALPARYLFYPAQYWPHKNHAQLLEAFASIAAEFPDIHLVFTGHARFEFAAVKTQIERLGLTQRVHQLGYVDGNDMPALYRLSTALVMPSLFESISIPVYEAFRTGTPVCASKILAIGEQVGDAGIVFDPYSVDSMVGAMKQLLSDAALRDRLVQKGREKLSLMTRERYASQLEGLIETSVG